MSSRSPTSSEGSMNGSRLSNKKRLVMPVLETMMIGGLVMFLLMLAAITEGLGYDIVVAVTSTSLQVKNHPCAGVICTGHFNASFNYCIYPISYATQKGQVSQAFDTVFYPPQNDPHIPSPAEMKEQIGATLAGAELTKNAPYLFAISCAVGFVIRKAVLKAAQKLPGKQKIEELQMKIGNGWTRQEPPSIRPSFNPTSDKSIRRRRAYERT